MKSTVFSNASETQSISPFWWLLTFVVAVALWSVDIARPVDLPGWHEIDYSSIARNFLREGNNILYPRIDWRGDGPGFTEMEFPIIPWLMAQLYRVFGIHEIIGRIFSLVFMLASLGVFSRLALKLLPGTAALVATLAFVISHEITIVSTAIQPESLMLLCYLSAVYCFVDWYESKKPASYAMAVLSFAAAVLVKSPAAHLAIFFLIWALIKDGLSSFRKPSLYLFAALSFAPALLWYVHASSLWHQFHNSMGVSNEDHWLGIDLLERPKVIANLVIIDLVFIFGGGGVLVVLASLLRSKLTSAVNRLALTWCVAVAIYLIVILRTSSGHWAAYYHVVAVPPIALLFGAGVNQLRVHTIPWRRAALLVAAPALLISASLYWLSNSDYSHMPGVIQDLAIARSSVLVLAVLILISFSVTVLCINIGKLPHNGTTTMSAPLASSFVVIGCFTYFLLSSQLLLGTWQTYETRTPQYDAASAFANKMSSNSLIVATGGICLDSSGHRVAQDAPNMFYWLDRKGFTTCTGHQSIAELQSFAKRGAEYFIADKDSLTEQPSLESDLRHSFLLRAESKAAFLFDLTATPPSRVVLEKSSYSRPH